MEELNNYELSADFLESSMADEAELKKLIHTENGFSLFDGMQLESGPARPTETRSSLMNGFALRMPSYGLMSIVVIDPGLQRNDGEDFYVAMQPQNAAPAEVFIWYRRNFQDSSFWIYDWGVGKNVFCLPLTGSNENAILKRWGRPYRLLDGRTVPSFAVFTYFNPNPNINRNVVCLLNSQNKWDLIWASNVQGQPGPATGASGWAACEWTKGFSTNPWPIIPNGTGCCEPWILDTNYRVIQPSFPSQIDFMYNLNNYSITNYSEGRTFLCQGPK